MNSKKEGEEELIEHFLGLQIEKDEAAAQMEVQLEPFKKKHLFKSSKKNRAEHQRMLQKNN